MLLQNLRRFRAILISALLISALAACGGGSGGGRDVSGSSNPPVSSDPPQQDTQPSDPPAEEPPAEESSPSATGPRIDECAEAKPEWIWCDDFERDRISSYFAASMPRRDGAGIDGSVGVVGRYYLGSSESGNLKLGFGRVPSSSFKPVDGGTRDYREVYWRMYLKVPADWQGGGGDKLSRATVFAGSDWRQAMIAHVWADADDSQYEDHLKIDPASGTDEAGNLKTTKYNDFANLRWLGMRRSPVPLFAGDNRGKWHCIEARVRLNDPGKSNGVFQLWENDVLSASREDLNWVGSYDTYGINAVFLENYWNKGTPVEQERYMDNFVVSTDRIGCGA